MSFQTAAPSSGVAQGRIPWILVGGGERFCGLLPSIVQGEASRYSNVVSIFTDREQRPTNRRFRFWKYEAFDSCHQRLREACQAYGIARIVEPISVEQIRAIRSTLSDWENERLCVLMCGYGQKITADVIEEVDGRYWNTHPIAAALREDGVLLPADWVELESKEVFKRMSLEFIREYHLDEMYDPTWPNRYAGGSPWDHILYDDRLWRQNGLCLKASIVLHKIDEFWDHGRFVTNSPWFDVPQIPDDLVFSLEPKAKPNQELGSYVFQAHQNASVPTQLMVRDFFIYQQRRLATVSHYA